MLTYGIVVRDGTVQAWQFACIEELRKSGLAQLVRIVEDGSPQANDPYAGFEARLGVAATKPVPTSALHGSTSTPDFYLLFSDTAHALEEAASARYGAWAFVYGEPGVYLTDVPGFWEVYDDRDVTCASLVQLRPDRSSVPLQSGAFSTLKDSVSRNVESLLSALPHWPAMVCSQIARGGAMALFNAPVAPPAAKRYARPNAAQIRRLRTIEAANSFRQYVLRQFFAVDWNVFALDGRPERFIGKDAPASVRTIHNNGNGVFVADPCLIQRGAQTYLFCEEYIHRENRGVISVLPLEQAKAGAAQRVIEEPFHLSYPQVFFHEEQVYCIAETARLRELRLYRARSFPTQWEHVHTLLRDFRAADATPLRKDGTWWIFCTGGEMGPKAGDDSDLNIWYADELTGPWTAHPRNPVKIDVRSSRPAGPFFSHDGALYRPAQDCSRTYGGAITINRVDVLTKTDFRETVAGVIRPPRNRYNQGIHTVTSAGSWCVVDAKRYVFNPAAMVYSIKQRIKKLAFPAR